MQRYGRKEDTVRSRRVAAGYVSVALSCRSKKRSQLGCDSLGVRQQYSVTGTGYLIGLCATDELFNTLQLLSWYQRVVATANQQGTVRGRRERSIAG